ncbi:uncharacterized protein LOC130374816 isoform X5 [Gadus chalcogrammus]|uniref:uncharacterized protein LOC130374816 isoform X5 n=1 Tax=Gadus chalcogrammus TaxID=1042646 RepID=UPI0024C4C222|nr:uncharacterized protein LOC130374816 isoform X5 [Gadus chalcogrammus]
MFSLTDIFPINDKCNKVTFSSDYGRTEFRAGDCVSLSCGAQSDCSIITWLFSYNNGTTVELVVGGKVKSEDKKERLHVTKECSLEVKKMRKEDEGHYTCREYPSPRRQVDHALHEVKLMTSTNRPTPTTVKANTSTSKPTTTPVKGAASSSPAARPSTSTPTTHTLNGNRAATEECIGLNSSSDAPPARERLGPGASDQQQHTVEMDLDWAPRGPSVVQRGGQRAVGSAQDQVDPGELSDAANYENLRAPPRCAGDTADTGVHFVTVHQLSK